MDGWMLGKCCLFWCFWPVSDLSRSLLQLQKISTGSQTRNNFREKAEAIKPPWTKKNEDMWELNSLEGGPQAECEFRPLSGTDILQTPHMFSHPPQHPVSGIPKWRFLRVYSVCFGGSEFHRFCGQWRFEFMSVMCCHIYWLVAWFEFFEHIIITIYNICIYVHIFEHQLATWWELRLVKTHWT